MTSHMGGMNGDGAARREFSVSLHDIFRQFHGIPNLESRVEFGIEFLDQVHFMCIRL